MDDMLIGQVIDDYRVDQLLGQGGMARVYRALDLKLERYVALKVISSQMRDPEAYQKRFHREARSVAVLKHPHIVGVYRYNDEANFFYMAMEFIDGADLGWILRDYRSRGELMDYDTLNSLMQQMTSALDYAHANGVIHRDIKPSNIMIDRQGASYLTDFGLVLLASEGTSGDIFGTPHYISPEQAINSATVVPASDLYSLGVVLYELLTGKIPYSDGSMLEIAMAHYDATLPDPLHFQPDLHPDLVALLRKALAKRPDERFKNGAALYTALAAALDAVRADAPRYLLPKSAAPAERIRARVPKLQAIDLSPPPKQRPSGRRVTAQQAAARRSFLVISAVLVTSLLFASAALFLLATRTELPFVSVPTEAQLTDVPSANSTDTATSRIVGLITDWDRVDTVTVYDLPLVFDENEDFLNRVEIGLMLEFEGLYSIAADGSLLVSPIGSVQIYEP